MHRLNPMCVNQLAYTNAFLLCHGPYNCSLLQTFCSQISSKFIHACSYKILPTKRGFYLKTFRECHTQAPFLVFKYLIQTFVVVFTSTCVTCDRGNGMWFKGIRCYHSASVTHVWRGFMMAFDCIKLYHNYMERAKTMSKVRGICNVVKMPLLCHQWMRNSKSCKSFTLDSYITQHFVINHP